MAESMTIFKGVVEDIGQVIGYMHLAGYYNAPSIALKFSSQGGEMYLLLKRCTITDGAGIDRYVGGFNISSAYFNDPKEFEDDELNERFVYEEMKKVFLKSPVAITGIKEPNLGKVVVPLNIPRYDQFVMNLCKIIDHDTRTIQIESETKEKTNEITDSADESSAE